MPNTPSDGDRLAHDVANAGAVLRPITLILIKGSEYTDAGET
jgi:hypothetical protein